MANTKISALTGATTPLAGTEVLPLVQSGATVKVAVSDLTTGRSISVSGLTNTGLTASKPVFTDASKLLTSTGVVPVANGGTNASAASIIAFNNITGYTASGATGTTSTNLVFSTSPSITTPTLVGDVTLSTGNVILSTSGKGVDFSATPGTGTSELFADYEEGTWTPTDASGASLSITVNAAYYTKIGRTINFYLDVTYPSTANASNAYLSLPFTPTADGAGSIGYNNIAYATQLFVNVASSVGIVRLLTNAGITLTNAALSTKRFQITGQYI
jgi:hypothetical protein